MADQSPQNKRRRYAQYKTRAPIHVTSKPGKPKFRYGSFAEKTVAGYWHNGVWRIQV